VIIIIIIILTTITYLSGGRDIIYHVLMMRK